MPSSLERPTLVPHLRARISCTPLGAPQALRRATGAACAASKQIEVRAFPQGQMLAFGADVWGRTFGTHAWGRHLRPTSGAGIWERHLNRREINVWASADWFSCEQTNLESKHRKIENQR